MKIDVHRQACCFQDDQIGPLDRQFELPADCTLRAFVQAVTDSRFLQFSSTHTTMSCRIGERGEVARVYGPGLWRVRRPVFRVDAEIPIDRLAAGGTVSFVFD